MHRDMTQALEATISAVRDDHERFIEYQTLLVLYAQQITPYVDTKDRHVASLMHALAAGLSGVSDELQKRWESMVARERRYDAQVSDIRSTLAVMHRVTQTLKRELEKGVSRPAETDAPSAKGAIGAGGAAGLSRRSGDAAKADAMGAEGAKPAASLSLDSYKYVGFEDQ